MSQQPYQPFGADPTCGTPAGLGDRFLARLIDGAILFLVSIVLGILGGDLVVPQSTDRSGLDTAAAVATLVGVAVTFAYYGLLDSSQGGTVGKKAMKLRVVAPDGTSRVSFGESARRNVFFALNLVGVMPLLGFLSSLAMLAAVITIAVQISRDTDHRQAWHDRFAGGTQVLKVG